MTREEALEYWKYKYDSAIMHNDIHYDTQECKQHEEYVKALEMAIKSLEMWEEVKQDLYKFVTRAFKDNIFDFICKKATKMTKEDFIKKYPYVAWYNK